MEIEIILLYSSVRIVLGQQSDFSIFKNILDALYSQFRANLVVVIDQINELKENKDQNKIYNMKFVYDLVQENISNLTLVQCASNNNEYTRENFKNFLIKEDKSNLKV